MKHFRALLLVLALCGCPQLVAQEQAPAEKPKPPAKSKIEPDAPGPMDVVRAKMKAFGDYEGDWVGEQVTAALNDRPELRSRAGFTGRFILDGTYFEMEGVAESGGGEAHFKWLYTYDPDLRKFRAWSFDSNGVVLDWLADHDPAAKEFVWKFATPSIKGWMRMKTTPNRVLGNGKAQLTENSRLVSDYSLTYRRKKIRI